MSWPTGEAAFVTDLTSPLGAGIARELAAAGVEVIDRAEAAVGRTSLVCDLGGVASGAGSTSLEDQPFAFCRWAPTQDHAVRALVVRPVSRLAAMGLIVPGSLSTRVDRTAGMRRVENGGPVECGHPDVVARMVVDALRTGHHLMVLLSEWTNGLGVGVASAQYDAVRPGYGLQLASA